MTDRWPRRFTARDLRIALAILAGEGYDPVAIGAARAVLAKRRGAMTYDQAMRYCGRQRHARAALASAGALLMDVVNP